MISNQGAYVVIIDSIERFKFFLRIYKALNKEVELYFVTAEPLVFVLCKLHGINVKLLWGKKETTQTHIAIDQSIELLNGEFTLTQASQAFEALTTELSELHKKLGVEKIICWNGQQVLGLAAKHFAMKNEIKTLFLELSNLPNKCFSDSLGVNGRSNVAKNPGILDKYASIDDSFHKKWMQGYIKDKKGALPQSKMNSKSLKIINYGLKFLYRSLNRHKLGRLNKVSSLKPFKDYKIDDTKNVKGFVFFPMQVSTDTQIKLNSDFGNIEAIKEASKLAREKGKKLIVKVHPAETSIKEINNILNMKKSFDFMISNQNTIELIESSNLVVTINSTVGLEAMIFDKPVVVLGRSLYADFDKERLKKYIHSYLIDNVDYFSNKTINKAAAIKLLGIG